MEIGDTLPFIFKVAKSPYHDRDSFSSDGKILFDTAYYCFGEYTYWKIGNNYWQDLRMMGYENLFVNYFTALFPAMDKWGRF